jgi:LPS-assembly lipoprotein
MSMQLISSRRLFLALVLVAPVLLQGCGFKLRGSVELAPVLQVTYLQTQNPYSGIAPPLREALQAAGAQLTEDLGQATAVLAILNERSERRVLSVGSGGKASEFELFEEVTFSLSDGQGESLLESQTLRITRALVFDETELLGKVSEAEQLREQMRRNLARQIMTRIDISMRQR